MELLRLVEIELWNYCNRKCKWCPNHFIDRQTEIYFLDRSVLEEVVESLKTINYAGYISFSRYNEPLAFPSILHMVCAYIKRKLPNCTLVTNTNGDYLTKETIESLLIDELSIMDYDNRGMEWCKNRLLDLDCTITEISDNFIYAYHDDMKILYYVNWKDNYVPGNRGGALQLEDMTRDYICTEPQYFIGVNYDGTVSPCCNIRSDYGQHHPFILGDLHDQSLSSILSSDKRYGFINYCNNAVFNKESPCYNCSNKGGRYTRDNGGIEYV